MNLWVRIILSFCATEAKDFPVRSITSFLLLPTFSFQASRDVFAPTFLTITDIMLFALKKKKKTKNQHNNTISLIVT